MMRRQSAIALFLVSIAATLLFAYGCGRKSWPEPMAELERFDFTKVTGYLENGCLKIRARISGKAENLKGFSVELARSGEGGDCPTCPFHAQQRIEVPLNAPNLKMDKRRLLLEQCGLEPGAAYRWRLVGYSSYPGLKPTETGVFYTEP